MGLMRGYSLNHTLRVGPVGRPWNMLRGTLRLRRALRLLRLRSHRLRLVLLRWLHDRNGQLGRLLLRLSGLRLLLRWRKILLLTGRGRG